MPSGKRKYNYTFSNVSIVAGPHVLTLASYIFIQDYNLDTSAGGLPLKHMTSSWSDKHMNTLLLFSDNQVILVTELSSSL